MWFETKELSTPSTLKLFSEFSNEILSIVVINKGSSGRPISVLL
jgi:hypothetical protein